MRNRASLQYILTAIEYPIFGYHLYPTLVEKASALAWWIIEGHVFYDGNKRTGMQSAILLLELNDAITHFDVDSVIAIAVGVANRDISLEQLTYLIRGRASNI
jgi:death-on-curing protein